MQIFIQIAELDMETPLEPWKEEKSKVFGPYTPLPVQTYILHASKLVAFNSSLLGCYTMRASKFVTFDLPLLSSSYRTAARPRVRILLTHTLTHTLFILWQKLLRF